MTQLEPCFADKISETNCPLCELHKSRPQAKILLRWNVPTPGNVILAFYAFSIKNTILYYIHNILGEYLKEFKDV